MDLTGKYNWLHNGITKNGDISLHNNGDVTHECGWSGGNWYYNPDGKLTIIFNGYHHKMMPTPDLKHLILVSPLRSPPTVAQFVENLKVHNKDDPDAKVILGKWDWNHDGVNKNGDLIFNANGKLSSTAWDATVSWQKLKDGQY